jgi:hypothetical protein
MTRSQSIYEVLGEMVSEVEDEISPMVESANELECELCGSESMSAETENGEVDIEDYRTACQSCGTPFEFTKLTLSAGDDKVPVEMEKILEKRHCHCSSPRVSLEDVAEENEPVDRRSYGIGVKQPVSKPIHKHHISYLPEVVINVCSSSHSKIHHRDGFHDELEPDFSRKEWLKMGVDTE